MEETRAENKLAIAVKSFKFSFMGKIVLDIGASTGGFTDLALKQGAEKVVAVEKGTAQMRDILRVNPKVELHEKTDIFKFKTGDRYDVVLADVSFVSLRKILNYVKGWSEEFLVLFKPQFETEKSKLEKGIIKNNKIRREIIKDFEAWLKNNNFVIVQKQDSQVAGRYGNVERIYWLKYNN